MQGVQETLQHPRMCYEDTRQIAGVLYAAPHAHRRIGVVGTPVVSRQALSASRRRRTP